MYSEGANALRDLGLPNRGVFSVAHHSFLPDGTLLGSYGRAVHEKTRVQLGNGKGVGQRRNAHVPRQALRQLLLDALPEGTVAWGKRLARLEEAAEEEEAKEAEAAEEEEEVGEGEAGRRRGGVTLHFSDGSWARADLVVGADGIWSSVRAHMVSELLSADETSQRGGGAASASRTELASQRAQVAKAHDVARASLPRGGSAGGIGGDPTPLTYLGVVVILGRAPCDHPLVTRQVFQTLDGNGTRVYAMPFTEPQCEEGREGDSQGEETQAGEEAAATSVDHATDAADASAVTAGGAQSGGGGRGGGGRGGGGTLEEEAVATAQAVAAAQAVSVELRAEQPSASSIEQPPAPSSTAMSASASPPASRPSGRVAMWQLSFVATEAEAAALRRDGASLLAEARRRVAGWHAPVEALIGESLEGDVTGYPAYDRSVPEALRPAAAAASADVEEAESAGTREDDEVGGGRASGGGFLIARRSRCTLIGDAAHPMSPFKGQGANQALLDAVDLARTIRRSVLGGGRESIEQSLDEFERRMLRRARPKVEASREAARSLHSEAAKAVSNTTRAAAARGGGETEPLPGCTTVE